MKLHELIPLIALLAALSGTRADADARPDFVGGNQLYLCTPAKADPRASLAAIRIYNWLGDRSKGLVQWDWIAKTTEGKKVIATLAPARLTLNTQADPSAYPVVLTVESMRDGTKADHLWTFVRQHEGKTVISVELREGIRELVCDGGF